MAEVRKPLRVEVSVVVEAPLKAVWTYLMDITTTESMSCRAAASAPKVCPTDAASPTVAARALALRRSAR